MNVKGASGEDSDEMRNILLETVRMAILINGIKLGQIMF